MLRQGTCSRTRLLALLSALVPALLAPLAGADSADRLRERAAGLRAQNAALSARSSEALLGLYALESRLARAREELASLEARAASVRQEQARARARLRIANRVIAASERRLADYLRALYEEGGGDPLAVLLGATSLDEAVTGLDDLTRSAAQMREIAAQAKVARKAQLSLARSLDTHGARVRRLESAAAATAAALERARAERAEYIAHLGAEYRLNAADIVSLEARARAVAAAAETISIRQSAAPSIASFGATAPEQADPRPAAGLRAATLGTGDHTLVVSATGYALPGTTATGIPVAWGVVAVDPVVIPLGTRMTVPGYGEAVAADVGSAVRGATIDLWFPTVEQALVWGRRTVTITLH